MIFIFFLLDITLSLIAFSLMLLLGSLDWAVGTGILCFAISSLQSSHYERIRNERLKKQ